MTNKPCPACKGTRILTTLPQHYDCCCHFIIKPIWTSTLCQVCKVPFPGFVVFPGLFGLRRISLNGGKA